MTDHGQTPAPGSRVAVLGQGIAGTLVSMRMRERGVPHRVIDRGHARASSRAAAGLVNPVTGRRFVLVADYEAYVARFGVYERLGALLGRAYRSPLTIYRDLSRVRDRNQWDLRRATPAYAPYLGAPLRAAEAEVPLADGDRWLGPTLGAYRVNLPGLIADYRALLREEGTLSEEDVDTARPLRRGGAFAIAGHRYDIVVDCRGAACAKTEEWGERPWRLSKGESVTLPAADWPRAAATKLGGCFLAPIGDAGELWYGGTSTDQYEDDAPTEQFRERARDNLRALVSPPASARRGGAREPAPHPPPSGSPASRFGSFSSAIRPTTTDRRPVVGAHPTIPGLYVCNGLGTKGALTAPSVTGELWSMLAPTLGLRP